MSSDPVSIHCVNATNRGLANHPVTYGVPLRAGALRDAGGLAIRLESGRLRPVQTRVLSRHVDGSIRWLLLDFEVPLPKNGSRTVTLTRARVRAPAGIQVREDAQRVTVTTPHYRVALSKKEFALF